RVDARSFEGAARRLDIEAAEIGEGRIRWDAREHEIRIGNRGVDTAASVARRTRYRAGALRSDDERAARIEARDRPTTGTDGVDVDRGETDRIPAHATRRCGLGHTAADQAHVGAGTAHVERDRAGKTAGVSDRRRGPHAPR